MAAGDSTLWSLHTPGHAPDHVAFLEMRSSLLFCGDLLVNGGTVAIAPSAGGDMALYLKSLRRLLEDRPRRIYPGHGPPVDNPGALIRAYITHRLGRETQILDELAKAPGTEDELTAASIPRSVPSCERQRARTSARTCSSWPVRAALASMPGAGRPAADGPLVQVGQSLPGRRDDPFELLEIDLQRLLARPGQLGPSDRHPAVRLLRRRHVAGLFELLQAGVEVTVGRAQGVAQFREGAVFAGRQGGDDPEAEGPVDDPVERQRGALWDGPGSHLSTVLRGIPGPARPACKNSRAARSRDMSAVPHPTASRFGDPRYFQIAVLTGLLTYGTLVLEFDVRRWQIPLTLAVALVTQWACSRLWKLPAFDPRSALISALSLCLLLRVDTLWVVAAAAFVAIASKFVVQIGKTHVFNPTNGAIVLMLLITPAAWLSPGQWGNVAFFAFLMACLGGLVAYRALRSDVALAFIVVYAALMFGRSYYLGEPMTIPMRRLESGGLLLFTFFMISDPRTTPDHPVARVLFGALVAYVAWYIQFRLFRTNGVIWSLALCAPLVPVLDRVLPGPGSRGPTPPSCRCAAHPVPCHRIGKDPRVMKRRLSLLFGLAALVAAAPAPADAFCGFFVAKADTKLFNKASKVVIARDGDQTVMTMSNDFEGEPKEFAIVMPVPTFLQKEQIHVGEQSLVDHLDAFTAPRLVEYFDENPCDRRRYMTR